ncbi:2-octaprenylphenol hydroxylase [Candidatus Hartigia pinicola]|nr:2-octaprenylphenol hydroxylase [Candidatus Hartigia pinicola]
MQLFDVVIAGGDIVGLALACGLEMAGLRVAVIEKRLPSTVWFNDNTDLFRVSAINAVTKTLLMYLDVWSVIKKMRVSSYHGIEVWSNDSFWRIQFSVKDQNPSYLGYIVENDVIRDVLWKKAVLLKNVSLLVPATIQKVIWGEDNVFVTLADQSMLTARLIVGADGVNSWLRTYANIPFIFWDYEQTALLATIRTKQSHEYIVRQVFDKKGILTFLPFINSHRCAIIWSQPTTEAVRRQQLHKDDFEKELSVAFNMRLGLCHLESDRVNIQLFGRYACHFSAQRLLLLGDAAYNTCLLGSQGMNLSLMNVAMLLGEIQYLSKEGKDFGQHCYLKNFERSCKYNSAIIFARMQGFCKLFDEKNPVKKLLRDLGLSLADRFPNVKPYIFSHVMGVFDVPDWLRKYRLNR